MQMLASSSSCATRLCSPKSRSERSSTPTRMDTVGCVERASRSGPTSSTWRRVVENAESRDDATLRLQFITSHTVELDMPGRPAQLQWHLERPHRKPRAHRRVDQLPIRNMIKRFQQIIEDCGYRVPVHCGPLTPYCLTQRSTPRACVAQKKPSALDAQQAVRHPPLLL